MSAITATTAQQHIPPAPTDHIDSTRDSEVHALESCLYMGVVRHRRLVPSRHEFRFHLFLFCINLDELANVFRRPGLISTRRWSIIRFMEST